MTDQPKDLSHGLHTEWLAHKSKQLISKAVAREFRRARGLDVRVPPTEVAEQAMVDHIVNLPSLANKG